LKTQFHFPGLLESPFKVMSALDNAIEILRCSDLERPKSITLCIGPRALGMDRVDVTAPERDVRKA